jgi:hypothetical protein
LKTNEFTLIGEDLVRVPAKDLDLNYVELTNLGYCTDFPGWTLYLHHQHSHLKYCISGSSLNPDRIAAGGKPLFSLWVMPWADDASGNQSKQYNAHLNFCTQNLNIPHEQLKHQYFVQFCSTSQHASSGEQFSPLIETWYGIFIFGHHLMLRLVLVVVTNT